ncbi:hypothetical protein GF380_02980 [Candidatus Uhrbacteria bacterium]|nr:hypothetical protein [Candidatus Uhrbacteria bacterium]MBD3284112.1 hypothetical protein [Candidatus Uhrbacteria bacterium]
MKAYSFQQTMICGSLGFLGGVMLHAYTPLDQIALWIPGAILLMGCCIPNRVARILLIFCAIGLFRFDLTLPSVRDPLGLRTGQVLTMEGRIASVRSYQAVLDVRVAEGVNIHSKSHVSFSSQGKWIAVGERWRVTCRLEKNEKSERRFQLWDARKGIFFRCRGSTSAVRVEEAVPTDLIAVLAKWRLSISRHIDRILPGDEGALLAGILYGERSLSPEANEAFKYAGMTHLIAVSGSNIVLVVSLFVPFFLWIGYRRPTAILLSGGAILLFSLFVGAEASVVRAAIMGWLAVLARVFGRKPQAVHLLLMAGTVMVLFDPWALAFDAGFALSFLATWGLIAWTEPLSHVLRWIPKWFGLREIVATTTAATLITTPYLLWAFESVSLAGLVTNLFAIPIVGFAMLWGAVALVFGSWISWLSYPAQGALQAMLLIASFANRFPFLKIALSIPVWLVFVSYGCIVLHWRLCLGKERDYPQESSNINQLSRTTQAFVRPF